MKAFTAPPPVTVPAGTQLDVVLDRPLSSNHSQTGQTFSAHLAAPVTAGGERVIPSGALITGVVLLAHSAGHFRGRSELRLELRSVRYNGHSYHLLTQPWYKLSAPRGKRTVEAVGGGGGLGAIIGAIAGGGKGAAVGAAIGAGAGTAAQALTKPPEVRLPAETRLAFPLARPLTVQPGAALLQP